MTCQPRLPGRTVVRGAVVAVALALLGGCTGGTGSTSDEVGRRLPLHGPPSRAVKSSARTVAWAESLPRGPDAHVAYVAGGTLVVDGSGVPLGDGVSVHLEAPLPGGWLAEELPLVTHPGDSMQTGFLSLRGVFRRFVYEPTHHMSVGYAVSPDESQVAYGGAVVDVATGEQVADLPADVAIIQAWTSQGIAYSDADHHTWVWRPGGTPQSMAGWDFRSARIATRDRGSCTDIAHTDDMVVAGTVCDEGVWSVSDSDNVFGGDGAVIDLVTRRVLGVVPIPDIGLSIMVSGELEDLWETDNQLLIQVFSAAPTVTFIVRCTIADEHVTCERASDAITSQTDSMVSMP